MRTGICCSLAAALLLGAMATGNPFLAPAAPAAEGAVAERGPQAEVADPAGEIPTAPLVEPMPRAPAPALPREGERTSTAETDEVGACPMPELEELVIRRGLDQDGWPTWWLSDGRVLKEVYQRAQAADGTVHDLPATMLFRPR